MTRRFRLLTIISFCRNTPEARQLSVWTILSLTTPRRPAHRAIDPRDGEHE